MNTAIDLAPAERDVLAKIVERAIAELRVEVRRTRNPAFHDHLLEEEQVLKELLGKLRPE